jgi:hypothetical protein
MASHRGAVAPVAKKTGVVWTAVTRASSLTTLPLTFSLFIIGMRPCPEIVDESLALFGLVRRRAQERSVQVALRQRTSQQREALERSEAARLAAERMLDEARLLYSRRETGGPAVGRESAAVLWALNAVTLAVLVVARRAYTAVALPMERKLMMVVLAPALLLRLVLRLIAVRRPVLESFCLVLLSSVVGYCCHILVFPSHSRA